MQGDDAMANAGQKNSPAVQPSPEDEHVLPSVEHAVTPSPTTPLPFRSMVASALVIAFARVALHALMQLLTSLQLVLQLSSVRYRVVNYGAEGANGCGNRPVCDARQASLRSAASRCGETGTSTSQVEPVAARPRCSAASRGKLEGVRAGCIAFLLVASACGRLGFADQRDGGAIDAADAPVDGPGCTSGSAQLMSPCAGTFSAQGAYFDLEATTTVSITGFETLSQNCGTRDVSIYYRPGTHVGFETSSAGWTLLGSATSFTPACAISCPITPTLVPIPFCVAIPAGQRAAFYIVMTSGTGTFESVDDPLGTAVVQDSALVLHAGRLSQGVGAFTGTIVDGKAWQGVIHYAP